MYARSWHRGLWVTALLLALAVQLALATLWSYSHQNSPGGARAAGEAGLEIGLGLYGSYTQALAPVPATATAANTKTETETETETDIPENQPEPVPAGPVTETNAEPGPDPAPPQPATAVTGAGAIAAKTIPTTELKAVRVDAEPILRAPVSATVAATTAERLPNASTRDATANAAQTARATAASGRAADQRRGGSTGSAKDYFQQLMAWLNRYKRYPVAAKKDKHEGIVQLQFTLNRQGEVLRSSVREGSGHAELDAAALAMLAQAAPLPALPDSIDRNTLTLVIPIEYSLITNHAYRSSP